MFALRSFLLCYRWLAFGLVVAALWMKAVVPAGFMPSVSDGRIWVQICTGQGPQKVLIDIPGLAAQGEHQGGKDAADGGDSPCLYSSLSAPALSGAAPALLALALAYIVALVFRATPALRLRPAFHLRPPPQGPPATY